MSRFKKLSHTIYECKFHMVWIPKYRYRVMTGEVQAYVQSQLKKLCDWKKLEVIEQNVCPEHVHIVLWIPPNMAVSQVVGFLKGKTALRIMDKFPSLRKRYWTKHFWSPGYCVTTIGLDEEKIQQYVRWQQKNDQAQEQSIQQHMFVTQ
jgi:putative transposase